MLETPEDRPRTQDLPPADELNALPAGTPFGALEILRTVGVGGFGIVYLAQDHALQRLVAVKEYMPGQLAQRGTGSQVSLRSSSHQDTFEVGRRSFVNEARLLARFDHRSLLKVYQFWEANGTAYMAMPFLQGKTLKQVRQAMSGPPNDAFLLKVLLPLLDGLRLLHGESVYHRDIAPDNILLPDGGGDPILLDFGAARHAIGDRTQMFTAILKPSFAPIEQYGEAAGLRQGPWTDLFALGAVAHYLVLGRPPPAATTRAVSDGYQPLAGMALPGLSTTVLAAIDWALRVRPQDRPQTVDEMRAALLGEISPPAGQASPPAADPERADPPPDPASFDATVPLSRALAAMALAKSIPKTVPVGRGDRAAAKARSAKRAPGEAKPSGAKPRGPHWVGPAMLWGGAVVLAVAAAGWWWTSRSDDTPSTAAADEPAATTPATTTATVPATAAVSDTAAPADLPVVRLSPPPGTGNTRADKPALRDTSAPKPAPVRDLSIPAADEPRPIPVTRLPQANDNTPTSVATGTPGTADPRAACGKKVFLAMALCIDRLCRDPAYGNSRECLKLRDLRDQRDQQRH
ncbi:serine/threonine protein kinase [Ideonella sp.]|uniref:serine/threonine protein kinase n=1 Tax=Ideonella sp. TaxID=1929293 RepID=UPI0035AE7C68